LTKIHSFLVKESPQKREIDKRVVRKERKSKNLNYFNMLEKIFSVNRMPEFVLKKNHFGTDFADLKLLSWCLNDFIRFLEWI
jgi:hypothetical protein